jgi:hypothetical protein
MRSEPGTKCLGERHPDAEGVQELQEFRSCRKSEKHPTTLNGIAHRCEQDIR